MGNIKCWQYTSNIYAENFNIETTQVVLLLTSPEVKKHLYFFFFFCCFSISFPSMLMEMDLIVMLFVEHNHGFCLFSVDQ